MKFLKKHFWSIFYSIALTTFTAYVLLDAFVIPRSYIVLDNNNTTATTSNTNSSIADTTNSTNIVSDTDSTNATSNTTDTSSVASGMNNKHKSSDSSGKRNRFNNNNSSTTYKNSNNTASSNTTTENSTDINNIESTTVTSSGTTNNDSINAVITDNSYSDDNIDITITEYTEFNTTIYVADIVVSSVDYLKTAFANNTYGKNVTDKTSNIANENNAILAINGDYYGTRSGYVIRNGILYRDKASSASQEDLAIYSDGSFEIISEGDITANELLEKGATQVLSFGPSLVKDSKISVSENDEVDKAMTSNPRTAIGIIDDLHYVMVVADGRTSESTGLSLYQLATFLEKLGVATGYNLDGGGSSTMYFLGNIVNNPTTNGNKISERSVSDIVYIGK